MLGLVSSPFDVLAAQAIGLGQGVLQLLLDMEGHFQGQRAEAFNGITLHPRQKLFSDENSGFQFYAPGTCNTEMPTRGCQLSTTVQIYVFPRISIDRSPVVKALQRTPKHALRVFLRRKHNKTTTFYVATSVSTLATNPTNLDGKPSLNRTQPSPGFAPTDSRLNQGEARHWSRPDVYVATEQEAFDLVEKHGLILGSKCWSHWLDEFEARICVYQSEDDKNYGRLLSSQGLNTNCVRQSPERRQSAND